MKKFLTVLLFILSIQSLGFAQKDFSIGVGVTVGFGATGSSGIQNILMILVSRVYQGNQVNSI